MPSTLVIVDMQEPFKAAMEMSVIVGVAAEIAVQRQHGGDIVFLEYKYMGETHRELTDLVKGYANKARVTKVDDDGSKELLKVVRRRGFWDQNFRVCGVNTDCCVWSTVEGILQRTSAEVEVVKNACGTSLQKRLDWRTYLKHPKLNLVSRRCA